MNVSFYYQSYIRVHCWCFCFSFLNIIFYQFDVKKKKITVQIGPTLPKTLRAPFPPLADRADSDVGPICRVRLRCRLENVTLFFFFFVYLLRLFSLYLLFYIKDKRNIDTFLYLFSLFKSFLFVSLHTIISSPTYVYYYLFVIIFIVFFIYLFFQRL